MQAQLILTDRLAAVGQLASGIAHEINNPLSYILLNLQYVAAALPELGRDPSRLSGLLARLGDATQGTERVARIIRDLRAFVRPSDRGRGRVHLASVLMTAVTMAAHEIRNRAKLVTTFGDAPPVEANESELEQAFVNLLVNAAQAIPDGDPERHEVRVALRADINDRVVVEISDTGVGIPPDLVGRIFDPFFTTKPPGVGTGLGLSVCHGINTSFGGTLSITREPGRGTSVVVSLPASLQASTAKNA
jgi:two-component system, NtrC family, sensor kinase